VARLWLVLLVLLADVSHTWAQVATVSNPVGKPIRTFLPVADLAELSSKIQQLRGMDRAAASCGKVQ
jgi:hypothetical protein